MTPADFGGPGACGRCCGWSGSAPLAARPATLAAFEAAAQEVGAPVFAFHTSSFMTTARALYQRLGYRRAPAFDRDLNAHYGVRAATDWTAIAYLKSVTVAAAATTVVLRMIGESGASEALAHLWHHCW